MIEIFIDETGDNGLNFEDGKSEPWFLICAVIVEAQNVGKLNASLDALARMRLNGGQIKSKNISDDNLRRKILEELPRNLWRGVILKVDKALLGPDKFKWKRTFYKRVPRQLFNYLIAAHDTAVIYPDPIGDADFQKSLMAYFVDRAPLNLFNTSNIEFRESKGSRLNQLADFCSGTLFRDLRDGTHNFNYVSDLVKIKAWPFSLRNFDFSDVAVSAKISEPLLRASVNFAKVFIEKYEESEEPLKKDQVHLARELLDEILNGDPHLYVRTKYLRERLSQSRMVEVGDYYFRTKVIGKLRTNDVLIVSNRKGGYKLPVNLSEIEEYFKNMTEKVEPMMHKASMMTVHVHTILGVDLLADPRWKSLRQCDEINDAHSQLTLL